MLCRAVLMLCKAVLGLCCGCAAKIPHILLYKEAFCLPFVSWDHSIIPSLTGHWSTTHSPFSILNILSWSTLINPYTLYILSYLTAIHINISASSLIKGPWFNSTWAQLPQQWPFPTRLFCHILYPVFLIFYNPTQRTWVQFLLSASSPYSLSSPFLTTVHLHPSLHSSSSLTLAK